MTISIGAKRRRKPFASWSWRISRSTASSRSSPRPVPGKPRNEANRSVDFAQLPGFCPIPRASSNGWRQRTPNIRSATVHMLARRGGSAAPIVRGLLGETAVQQAVLHILIAADDPEYIPDIRAVVDNPNLQVAAVQWLVGRGDVSVAPTLRAMAERTPGWHLEQLARLRLPEDIPLFRNALEVNASHYLRVIRNWPEARQKLAREIRSLAREGVSEAIQIGRAHV